MGEETEEGEEEIGIDIEKGEGRREGDSDLGKGGGRVLDEACSFDSPQTKREREDGETQEPSDKRKSKTDERSVEEDNREATCSEDGG